MLGGISAACKSLSPLLGIHPPPTLFTLNRNFRESFVRRRLPLCPLFPSLWCPLKRHEKSTLHHRLRIASLFSLGLSWGENFLPSSAKKCWLVIAKAFLCHLSSHLCYSQLEFPLSLPCLFPQLTCRKESFLFVPHPRELPLFEAAIDKGLKSLKEKKKSRKEHSTQIFNKMMELESVFLSGDVYFFY